MLVDKGYDGIKYSNTHETQKPTTSYIVFDSNQAKLITNTNPTTDKDIRHKIRYPSFSQTDINNNINAIVNMDSIVKIDSAKLEKTGKKPFDIFSKYFESWGNNIYSDVFGDIALPKSSAKSEIRHGITAEKIASREAIPKVIQNGKVIFQEEKEAGVERIVVCAPISIGAKQYYMGVMLQRDSRYQRLYLHNVLSIEIAKEAISSSKENLLTTGALEDENHLSMSSILKKVLNVKMSQQKSDENSSEDIRHKARATSTTPAYISPTASNIVTDIDSGYDYTLGDKIATATTSAQIAFTNAQAGIEKVGKKYGVDNIEAMVQAARVSSNQAQQMLAGSQYRIGSSRVHMAFSSTFR